MSDSRKKVTYQPFSSILNPGFWQQLTNVKLNDLKLNTGPVKIRGSYSHGKSANGSSENEELSYECNQFKTDGLNESL